MKKHSETNGTADAPRELQSETLLTMAREYFATDFSHSDRRACPDRLTLNSLAQGGRLPDAALRAHLFGCSACFQAYRAARAACPAPVRMGLDWRNHWRRLSIMKFGGLPLAVVLASAAFLLGICLLTWARWRAEHSPDLSLSVTTEQAAPTLTPTLQTIPQTPTVQPAAPVEQVNELTAPPTNSPVKPHSVGPAASTTVRVDLNEYVALRGVTEQSGSGKQVINLAPVLTRLQLRLPEGSPTGAFTISLVDAYNRVLASTIASSSAGNRLVATFDLGPIAAKAYCLRIFHPAEPPSCYPVLIQAQNRNP